jgi:hypothetical protein
MITMIMMMADAPSANEVWFLLPARTGATPREIYPEGKAGQ